MGAIRGRATGPADPGQPRRPADRRAGPACSGSSTRSAGVAPRRPVTAPPRRRPGSPGLCWSGAPAARSPTSTATPPATCCSPRRRTSGSGRVPHRAGQRGRGAAGHGDGLPRVRRRGLGRVLMQAVVKDLVKRGGIRAVEAIGDTRAAGRGERGSDTYGGCVLPGGLPAQRRLQDPPAARPPPADAARAEVGGHLARGGGGALERLLGAVRPARHPVATGPPGVAPRRPPGDAERRSPDRRQGGAGDGLPDLAEPEDTGLRSRGRGRGRPAAPPPRRPRRSRRGSRGRRAGRRRRRW